MDIKVYGISLDIYKACDKVWYDGVIFKLRQNGICGEMINISKDFLSDRKQRVILNGHYSYWFDIHTGASLGFIFEPLLFLTYNNDLSNDIKSKVKLFVNDTSLFSVVHDIVTSANDLNNDLEKISEWVFQ